MPPCRLCVVCGLKEQDWGPGFKKLVGTPKITGMSFKEFLDYQRLRPFLKPEEDIAHCSLYKKKESREEPPGEEERWPHATPLPPE